jgi:general secretion pathway protein B
MSFILDALRKSEIERQRQSGPSMAEFPVARQDKRLPVALIAIGFLLAVNLAVVLFFMLRSEKSAAPAATATQVAAAPPASVTSPPPAAATQAPAQVPPADVTAAAPRNSLPGAAPGPGSVTYLPADGFEDPTAPPGAPDPTLLPEAVPPESDDSGATYGAAPAAEEAAAVIAATGLPPHIFADDPAKRAVFINGRRYTQGTTIAEGPKVEQITRDGAVMSYRGRRFLLPRL